MEWINNVDNLILWIVYLGRCFSIMDCVFGILDVVFSVHVQSPPTKLLMEWMRPFSAAESHLAVKNILVITADNGGGGGGGENKNASFR